MTAFGARARRVGGIACLLLAACSGGGGGGGSSGSGAGTAQATGPTQAEREADAGRLAKQASFGATPALVDRIVSLGVSGWLDEQFAATGSTYADLAADPRVIGSCGTDAVCFRHNFTREPVAMRFYADALGQPDQLRQRVALALSELLVASTTEVGSAAGVAAYNQILLDNAFGNYRTVLLAITLNGFMGDYLDMADSNRAAPSENYAREFLQLFTMGPDQLGPDGTPARDATGATVPNYTADDIKAVARALTGWTYARLNGAAITDGNSRDYTRPMIQVAARYDNAAKTFLGTTVAAGASQDASVQAVVDAAFNNASTPPYVARFLIRHLVTANPSAAYVGRVAAVFANDGTGTRGNLKAVVRAILTDAEARAVPAGGDGTGKVREPVLLLAALARATGTTGDGYAMTVRDAQLGEPVFQSPSVFNFYPPDYPLPKSTTLVSPASKLLTTGSVLARHNLVYDWTVGAATARSEFNASASVTGSTGTTQDWSGWEALGTSLDGMVDRIDLLLMNRTMTAAQKSALKGAATAVTNADATAQARRRAQAMLYVVAASPLFQVDR